MLNRSRPMPVQRGVVLLLTIIVLVAMSLAGIGLMRSVLTSNRVAGNLAFQQSAAQSGNVGLERAIAWLERTNTEIANIGTPSVPAPKLSAHITADTTEPFHYRATRTDPTATQNWEAFWQTQLAFTNALPVDAAGNTVSFLINRLCTNVGTPAAGAACEASPILNLGTETSSKSPGRKLATPSPLYYRITVRVVGPRNSVAFSQAVVAL